jgi:hypothetical protein
MHTTIKMWATKITLARKVWRREGGAGVDAGEAAEGMARDWGVGKSKKGGK